MKSSMTWRGLSVALIILGATLAGRADNWPQWRGPTDDGICKETNLPVSWSETKNVVWKLKLPGFGSGTPAIWGDRIFLNSEEGDDLVLVCLSTEGKELWKRVVTLSNGQGRFMRGEGNNASPSPSTDGKNVYTFMGTGDFACFDFDGKLVWQFNAQVRYGEFSIQHGMHVTPLLHGDRLYLALLHSNGHWLIALDKATGKEVWKVERKTDGYAENEHSYASPVLGHSGQDEYLIVHGNDYTTAHRLKDGSEIWRVSELNPKANYNQTLRFVATPVASADLIVIPSAKRGPVVGIKPDASGLVSPGSAFELWRRPKGTPDVPSPLIHDGLVYLCGESGMLTCVDAKTGQTEYEQQMHRAVYRASPVYADGKIYCTAKDGVFTVVKTGRKFEKLAENRLPDGINASPAISNGRIYLRAFEALYAIGEK